MREPKDIAIDILNGDDEAKRELEKMIGKPFGKMTVGERRIGVAALSAFENIWRKGV